MKMCYVDESGTDEKSPVVVMVGIVTDCQRLRRTQEEFEVVLQRLNKLPRSTVKELKSSQIYNGKGKWHGVDGEIRHAAISDLCNWVCTRKHKIALAVIDKGKFHSSDFKPKLDIWEAAALHITLQIQRSHQRLERNKGNTFLVFDENKQKTDRLAELLFEPPDWTDNYYKPNKTSLDQIIDTAFYARSHHVGLVQVADIFAFVFRRHTELQDHGHEEKFEGEKELIRRWIKKLATRLIDRADRWPKRTSSECAASYVELAPSSLLDLT